MMLECLKVFRELSEPTSYCFVTWCLCGREAQSTQCPSLCKNHQNIDKVLDELHATQDRQASVSKEGHPSTCGPENDVAMSLIQF